MHGTSQIIRLLDYCLYRRSLERSIYTQFIVHSSSLHPGALQKNRGLMIYFLLPKRQFSDLNLRFPRPLGVRLFIQSLSSLLDISLHLLKERIALPFFLLQILITVSICLSISHIMATSQLAKCTSGTSCASFFLLF